MNSKAWRDLLEWNLHVEKRKTKKNSDYFGGLPEAKSRAFDLITDFKDEPDSSVITIFEYKDGYQIDAITNHPEFELHREEYDPEDVVALVFYRKGERIIKDMK